MIKIEIKSLYVEFEGSIYEIFDNYNRSIRFHFPLKNTKGLEEKEWPGSKPHV